MGYFRLALTAGALIALTTAASAQTLTYATQEDPDQLDPAQGGTYGGRVVFAGLCDKLVDISPELAIQPMLATSWEISPDGKALTFHLREGITFHDGTPFDAEAVAYNIDRAKTLPVSRRKGELAQVERVEAPDPLTARFVLSAPFTPLLSLLTDRAGMMISPKAAEALGDRFGTEPVCSGPFRFLERVAQDHITLERYADYWNKDAIHLDRVVYRYVADPTLRLAQLQAGDIDVAERVAATDLEAIRADANLQLLTAVGLGVSHLHINVNNGPQSETPLGQDPRVREAFELALDREIINQVAFNGEYVPGNQMVPPNSPFYIKEFPIPARDLEKAKALLAEAGHERVPVELTVANTAGDMRVAEIVQSLAGEAGFDVTINAMEIAAGNERYFAGNFEMFLGNWSGRSDPDGNLYTFLACDGGQNFVKYCNDDVQAALTEGRTVSGHDARYAAYARATEGYLADRPTIPIYHSKWLFGALKDIEGLVLYPDALMRLPGVRKGS